MVYSDNIYNIQQLGRQPYANTFDSLSTVILLVETSQ